MAFAGPSAPKEVLKALVGGARLVREDHRRQGIVHTTYRCADDAVDGRIVDALTRRGYIKAFLLKEDVMRTVSNYRLTNAGTQATAEIEDGRTAVKPPRRRRLGPRGGWAA